MGSSRTKNIRTKLKKVAVPLSSTRRKAEDLAELAEVRPVGMGRDSSEDPFEATPEDAPTYIVGIGASAGGLEALERLLKGMPVDTGMAFIIIQHLSPDFKSLMHELLARYTKMPIVPVLETTRIVKNTVYLLTPRKEMVMAAGRLFVHDRPVEQQLTIPINVFFRSLAREAKDRSIGIVLSGTGSDGTAGLMDIHDVGGLVLVQSEESAKFDGMPKSAIDTGLADLIVTPEEMGKALLGYAANPAAPLAGTKFAKVSLATLSGLPLVLEKLREVYGIDFNFYKPATISRRIDRRISLMRCSGFGEYSKRVLNDGAELDALYKDLLIGVTRFFRDPEAFAILEGQVIPKLIRETPLDEDIRVWVAGCASGEEAYSLAILFVEGLEKEGRRTSVRIFASDVHRDSLQIASEGLYDEATMEDVSEVRRERFFNKEGSRWRVSPLLRKMLVLSPQNLIKDPPFTKMDLVSCRNLLIYFQPVAQTKALASFHFALKLKGHLFLGPSESPGELENEFETVDRQWKLYQKVRDTRLPMDIRMNLVPTMGRAMTRPAVPGDLRLTRAYEALLSSYVPTGVLLNERREVLHVFGEADRYLRPPTGRMTQDLINMVRGDLRVALSSAIQSALKRHERVAFKGVRIDGHAEGRDLVMTITVDPIPDKATNTTCLFVRFCEEREVAPITSSGEEFQVGEATQERIVHLEQELIQTKESLQTTVEELETSNEELQASNEELLAANEELQSTNEELHSVNEELYSVNAEHEQKIKELIEITNDLNNLMRSTEIGTIFLDRQRCVRLFTPAASEIFHLLPQDVGRDIKHITCRVHGEDVLKEIDEVYRTQKTIERKVVAANGRSYLSRIMPYQDEVKKVSGLVMTFVDVTEITEAEKTLRERSSELEKAMALLTESEETFRNLVEWAPNAVALVNKDGRIELVNSQMEKLFGYSRPELIGQTIETLIPHRFRGRHVGLRRDYHNDTSPRPMGMGRDLFGLTKEGREVPIEIGLSPLRLKGSEYVVATISDIRERKMVEMALQASEERFRAKLEMLPQLVWTCLPDGRCDYLGPQWVAYTGVPAAEQLGYGWADRLHPEDRQRVITSWNQAVGSSGVFDIEFRIRRHDGAYHWFKTRARPFHAEDGTVVKWFGTNTDIDELRRAEDVVKESLKEKETLLKEIHHRVKNNMQLISSLLQLQSDYIKNPEALGVFREGQNRVRSMALIHEKLYRATSLAQIDFAEYIRSLVTMLMPTYSTQPEQVTAEIQAAVVELRIDTAIPLALILNELISNILKHAFPGGRLGRILVKLSGGGESGVELLVRDDGVGLPRDFDWASTTSLGLHLVKILTGQIDGEMAVRPNAEAGSGVEFELKFREVKRKRVSE